MKSKIVVYFLIFVVVVLGVIGFYYCKSKSRVLVATGHPEWAPIMWQSGNKIIGVGPDLVQKICIDLKIVCDVKFSGLWDVVQSKAKTGEVDMLVAAYKTDERQTYMNYSDPYTTDPISIFVKTGKEFSFSKSADLIGKKGVLMTGDSYGQEFDDYITANLTVERVATAKEAFDKIISGQDDYFVYAYYSGKKEIISENIASKVTNLPTKVAEESFYITVSKKSPFANLMPKINELIAKYKTDGTITNLITNNEKLSGLNK